MAEKRKALLSSSLSINSIRDSVTNFSKSLRRSGVIASDIVKKTRQNNIFNQNTISKENEYFRKRRENVRRKEREDELESSSISGVTKKEGNIVSRSTKGFLGRILDFFGIILIGWFVNKLPEIIKAIRNVIKLIRKATGFLTGFLDGVKEFLSGIGTGIKTLIDTFPKLDLLNFKNESEKTLAETENRAKKINEEFFFGLRDYSKNIDASYADEPGIVENGEVVIPNDDGGEVVGGEISEDNSETGEDTQEVSDSNLITAIRPDEEQDEKLQIQENQEEDQLIANLDKLDQQSKRLANVYDGKKNKVTEKVEKEIDASGIKGGSGGGGGAQSSGGGIVGGTATSGKKDNKFEASGFDDEDTSTDDSTSMGTPEAGDFYVTKGGQGNKQSFYHVLQPNGKIKSIGKRKPDGGSKFTRSEIVAAGNNIKSQNIKGVSSNDGQRIESIISTDTSGGSGLVEPIEKQLFNLEKIFKDDRPTVIFKEIGFDNSNIQMPSLTGGTKLDLFSNINFDKTDDDLDKIHSLLLDGI